MEMNFEDTTQILPLSVAISPKVLLVDDDELMLEHLKILITAAGFEVLTAQGGEAALASLHKDFTPIVILDRNMPGMDGLALCRAIRQQTFAGYVYVILLTVHDSEDDILGGLDAGADDYLSKRASTAQLVARMRTARRILSLERALKGMIEERRRMAMTDVLTGVNNRRYFIRNLEREIKRSGPGDDTLCLLALDIDHFKRVNDQYGHAAGDAVLVEFVRRIRACLPRETDWCARLGGEEFAVVLPQTGLIGAATVAERIRHAVEARPMHVGHQSLPVTVSIGVSGLEALADPSGATVEVLIADADRYLYRSKETGRNRVTSPGQDRAR